MLYCIHMSEELISAYDIRGTEDTGLTIDCAWNAGKALADWLAADGEIVVAYTPEYKKLAEAVVEGLRLQGRNVIDGGTNDKNFVTSYIVTGGLAGAVFIGFDEMEKVITIEFYQEGGKLIDRESGLREICDSVRAGNFVPAATKGSLRSL